MFSGGCRSASSRTAGNMRHAQEASRLPVLRLAVHRPHAVRQRQCKRCPGKPDLAAMCRSRSSASRHNCQPDTATDPTRPMPSVQPSSRRATRLVRPRRPSRHSAPGPSHDPSAHFSLRHGRAGNATPDRNLPARPATVSNNPTEAPCGMSCRRSRQPLPAAHARIVDGSAPEIGRQGRPRPVRRDACALPPSRASGPATASGPFRRPKRFSLIGTLSHCRRGPAARPSSRPGRPERGAHRPAEGAQLTY